MRKHYLPKADFLLFETISMNEWKEFSGFYNIIFTSFFVL